MAIPIPGKSYIVVPGDNLYNLAGVAYGQTEKWSTIWKANQTTIKSGDPNLIYPGEVLIIPKLAEREKLKNESIERSIKSGSKNELKIIVNEIELPVQEAVITRTMDTCSDGFTASIAWTPGKDSKIDEATRPYGYQDAKVYIGGKLQVSGYLSKPTPYLTDSGRGKSLEFWSYTVDTIDSTMKPPYEVNNYTLKDRATELIELFGISVDWKIDDDLKFDKMTADAGDTVFEHLLKYAKQRGVLISCTENGDMLFWRADTTSKSIGTIEEGKQQGFLSYEASFDGRKRFNSYKAIGQSPGAKAKFEIVKDDKVPKSRSITFDNPDATKGDLKSAAEWRRSTQLAEALTIPFISTSWFSPNGDLWEVNKIVTVVSETISLKNGFDFLITQVEFNYSNSGRTAKLNLVPPQVYSGEEIPDIFV